MKNHPKCYGIIPARYESLRFPGKPLAQIQEKPMFWHVYQQARKCPELTRVTLATDDQRILAAAEKLGVPAVMTRKDHASGTDRVLEAATLLGIPHDTVVVNIQGDEPLLEPAMLTELLQPFAEPGIEVTTLARKIGFTEAQNPDLVKVVFSAGQRALYFSRAIIPFDREPQNATYYGHIGVYAFRLDTLNRFVALSPSGLEMTERLEQLRLLENDIAIHVGVTTHKSIGVDRPEDLELVRQILSKQRINQK